MTFVHLDDMIKYLCNQNKRKKKRKRYGKKNKEFLTENELEKVGD